MLQKYPAIFGFDHLYEKQHREVSPTQTMSWFSSDGKVYAVGCKFSVKTRFVSAFVTEPNLSSKAKFTDCHLMSCVTLGVQTHLVRPLVWCLLASSSHGAKSIEGLSNLCKLSWWYSVVIVEAPECIMEHARQRPLRLVRFTSISKLYLNVCVCESTSYIRHHYSV